MNARLYTGSAIVLKNGTSLESADDIRYGQCTIRTYDDGDGPLWVFGRNPYAGQPEMVIRARSFETAWEIAIDECATIPESEVPEAYGFYSSDHADPAKALRDAADAAHAGLGEYPELVEGYEYQSNCTGTGIVDVGRYAWLREMTREDCATIRLTIRAH